MEKWCVVILAALLIIGLLTGTKWAVVVPVGVAAVCATWWCAWKYDQWAERRRKSEGSRGLFSRVRSCMPRSNARGRVRSR
ncbi:MAG TPA: hypothetical protein VD997_13375 [Phycisphaerales bacterium]|nr:hypothetical protein [Phycisphaerales bacterium]